MVLTSKWGRIQPEIQIWWLWCFIQSYWAVWSGAWGTKRCAQVGFWADIALWTSWPTVQWPRVTLDIGPSSSSILTKWGVFTFSAEVFRVTCSSGARGLKLHLFINSTKMSSLSNYYGIMVCTKWKSNLAEMRCKVRCLCILFFVWSFISISVLEPWTMNHEHVNHIWICNVYVYP